LPHVTIESALEVPAVFDAVSFLSRTLAALPLHAYRKTAKASRSALDGDLQMLLNEAPNPEWSSFAWRQYMWQQVFTGGRGCTWIERAGVKAVALWPMDPTRTSVRAAERPQDLPLRQQGISGGRRHRRAVHAEGQPARRLRPDRQGQEGDRPGDRDERLRRHLLRRRRRAAAGARGAAAAGPDAFKRAQADIQRAIDLAKKAGTPFFGMPPGHALKAIGIDPDKGQMTEARLFQIQEIARLWGFRRRSCRISAAAPSPTPSSRICSS
jgi:phage portal protein BeeE